MTAAAPPGETPVFVHSSFRTSSTWLWAKFRVSPRNVAFYEVFNAGLETMRIEDIPNLHPAQWRSGHPPGDPYFTEFAPLFKPEGGVKGYVAEMAETQFIPRDGIAGTLAENEAGYLNLLIGHARGLRKTPVITSTRSLGRMGAMRRAFGGVHLFIYRNLFRQWCSYVEQYHQGNPFFTNSVARLLEASKHDPFLSGVAEAYPPVKDAAPESGLFLAFALIHLYLYAHATMQADLTLDADRLAADADYRRTIEAETADRLGQALDLADARASIGFILGELPPSGRIAVVLNGGIADIRRAMPGLPLSAGAFLQGLVDELVAEHERWKFYAGRLAGYVIEIRKADFPRKD